MKVLTVTPASGRDYRSAAAAIDDWKAGKDFLIADVSSPWDGKPISIRDNQPVRIRYSKLRRLTPPIQATSPTPSPITEGESQ